MDQKKDSIHRLGDGVSKSLSTLLTKKSSLVMMDSTNGSELLDSKLVAPIATVALGSPINCERLMKCILRHVNSPLLHLFIDAFLNPFHL
jgi:hypothetical protein